VYLVGADALAPVNVRLDLVHRPSEDRPYRGRVVLELTPAGKT
jgi:hypothetical protein